MNILQRGDLLEYTFRPPLFYQKIHVWHIMLYLNIAHSLSQIALCGGLKITKATTDLDNGTPQGQQTAVFITEISAEVLRCNNIMLIYKDG